MKIVVSGSAFSKVHPKIVRMTRRVGDPLPNALISATVVVTRGINQNMIVQCDLIKDIVNLASCVIS